MKRYQNVIDIWTEARDVIQNELATTVDRRNNIYMMSDSGARGSISNFTQLAGMRGLIAGPSGKSWNYRLHRTSVKDFLF